MMNSPSIVTFTTSSPVYSSHNTKKNQATVFENRSDPFQENPRNLQPSRGSVTVCGPVYKSVCNTETGRPTERETRERETRERVDSRPNQVNTVPESSFIYF